MAIRLRTVDDLVIHFTKEMFDCKDGDVAEKEISPHHCSMLF